MNKNFIVLLLVLFTFAEAHQKFVSIGKIANHNEKKEFYEEIALLRALAILAVLAYHFWPQIFPFGYIGVDIFFVISGYLIMMILDRSPGNSMRILREFYYRRLKRICPLYFLIIFFSGFCAMFVYTAIWAQKHFVYYGPAVLFGLNIKMLQSDGNYFEVTTEDMPFLHFWSLAVEVQFYLVAPLIFFLRKARIEDFRIGPLLILFIFFASLIFQYKSSSITAFYHPMARLWQFLVGMMASMCSKELDILLKLSPHMRKIDMISMILLALVLLIFTRFPPAAAPPNLMQFFTTITSGSFILFAHHSSLDWSKLHLQYIAQISYSLYLVHYPVLRFVQYLANYYSFHHGVKLMALFIIFLLSIGFHHFYEKPHLGSKKKAIIKEVIKYFVLSLLINWKWPTVVHPECFLKATLGENAKYIKSLYILEGGDYVKDAWGRQETLGHYRWKNGNGTHKVVIVGNSWATQQAHIVREILNDSYVSTMDLFSWPTYAAPFHNMDHNRSNIFWEFVETTRPEIVFIILRYTKYGGDLKDFKAPENDTILNGYLNGVKRLSMFANDIFIEMHQPFCPNDNFFFLNNFIDKLQKGVDLKDTYSDFDEKGFDHHAVHERLKIVFAECPKCHWLYLAEPFIDRLNRKVITFDPATQLSYLDNDCHLTASGLHLIKKPFRETVERVLDLKELTHHFST